MVFYVLSMNEVASWPLPEEPLLRQAAIAIRDAQHYATVWDARGRLVYATDAQVQAWIAAGQTPPLIGTHTLNIAPEARIEANNQYWIKIGGFALADTPGGKEELRGLAHPDVQHLIDEMIPVHEDFVASELTVPVFHGTAVKLQMTMIRIRDETGRTIGSVGIAKFGGNAFAVGQMTYLLRPSAVDQMHAVTRAARRPAAILCADIEGSSALSARLSAASYFQLTRRLTFAADRCVVNHGGLVGRHAGDGVTAFFLVESLGSESAAAKACISAARQLIDVVPDVAIRSNIDPQSLVLRFGLHWGSTLYVGSIMTEGRFEVTAMGDEVNEAARIEACATGGLTLASKSLIERLDFSSAKELGLDQSQVTYSKLAELPTATDKARRDAPAIAVCSI